jgi:hypothetical protein
MNLAIYDDDLIDAAKNRATNPNMGLTALQVSGAMPCFLRMIIPENRDHAQPGPMSNAAGHDRERRPRAAAIA